MKVIVYSNKKKIAERVAAEVCDEIEKNPRINLGLASGRTMVPVYKKIVALAKKKELNLTKICTFNLDEYVGIGRNDKKSMRKQMEKNLFIPLRIKKEQAHFPDEFVKNPERYDLFIEEKGGIEIQLLGIGRNGHIGFNEPGSLENSRTRIVRLAEQTKKDNKIKYEHAITMGIKTIAAAKKKILIAMGGNKSKIIRKFIEGSIGTDVPATFLRKEEGVLVLLDKDAARELTR